MAEHLIRQRLETSGIPCEISSAGILAETGRPMHPHAIRALQERGIATDGWRARAVNADMLAQADLILIATASQRRALYDLDPQLSKRTFRLLSFARLAPGLGELDGDDPQSFEASLNERAAVARSRLAPVESAEDDLKDPLGRSRRPFNQCATRLQAAATAIVTPFSVWREDSQPIAGPRRLQAH